MKIPKGLEAAIEHEQPKLFQEDYGTVELVIEKYKLGHGLKLTIKEASYIRSVVERKEGSRNNFEDCREAIAKSRGYPASEVKGDGDPIEKGNNVSFMFKGRSKDLFFCEVTPSGEYEITAAIGGEFPFKQIGTGKFK